MRVLSLFDGMSVAQIALKELGIIPENYYASEIDKYAIAQTQLNFPNTIQLGSVTEIKLNQKMLLLSEAYDYLCHKYFNDDIHSLQSIISEREMLHRINEKQTFAAYFGAQIQNEKPETSENTNLSINDRIWFFRNKMGDDKGVYDIIRCGERRKIANKIDVGELCKHSFWWNGYGQSEPRTTKEGFSGINREESNRENEGKNKKSSNTSIFNEGIEGSEQNEGYSTTPRPNKKNELSKCDVKSRYSAKDGEEITNRGKEKNESVYDTENKLSSINEDDRVSENNRNILSVHTETQITVVECEWGVLIFSGTFQLCTAGSPCQGFSFAGKQLALDDPRSKLFFVFIDILNHCKELNPEVKFLLENVDMKKDHRRVINEMTGVFGQNINSNLVSAQNRSRWYWHNIKTKLDGFFDEVQCDIPQPKDQGVLLRDILEGEVDEKFYISQAVINRMNRKEYSQPKINPEKTGSLNTKNNSGCMSLDSGTTFISVDGKSPAQRSATGRSLDKKHNYQVIELTGTLNDNGIIRETEKSNCVDANYWKGMDNHAQRSMIMTKNHLQWDVSGKGYKSQQDRAFYEDGKHGSLAACRADNKNGVVTESRIRRLMPIEVSRLQTIPETYIWNCSDTQIYRMCGNGWTSKVIEHILSYLEPL